MSNKEWGFDEVLEALRTWDSKMYSDSETQLLMKFAAAFLEGRIALEKENYLLNRHADELIQKSHNLTAAVDTLIHEAQDLEMKISFLDDELKDCVHELCDKCRGGRFGWKKCPHCRWEALRKDENCKRKGERRKQQ